MEQNLGEHYLDPVTGSIVYKVYGKFLIVVYKHWHGLELLLGFLEHSDTLTPKPDHLSASHSISVLHELAVLAYHA